ncbi:uncharacterized protein WM294_007845 [Sarcoramphus papa]
MERGKCQKLLALILPTWLLKTGSYKRRGKRKGEQDRFPRLVGLCLYYLQCSCLQAVDQSVKILLHYCSALHCRTQRLLCLGEPLSFLICWPRAACTALVITRSDRSPAASDDQKPLLFLRDSRAKCRRADLGGKRLPEAPALILSPYIRWTNPPAICQVCMISLCFYMDHF